jgi:hypothetical protein
MGTKNKNRFNGQVNGSQVQGPTQQPAKKADSTSPIQYILDQQKFRTRQDMLTLRIAVDTAENPINYDRELYHRVCREVIRDPQLSANWENRKLKVKQRTFKVVTASGDEDKDRTNVLQTQWFKLYLDAVLDSHLWGFTLMEFGPLLNGKFQSYTVKTQYGRKMFQPVTVLDRDNVKPELGIITSIPGQNTGISWDDPKYSKYLLFVGDYRSRGILDKAAKYVLFKDNALGNWSEWAEVFGMDIRVGKTNTQGTQREAFLRAIRDMGTSSYGVFNLEDEIEFAGTSRTDAFRVYESLLRYIDEQLANLVFGQNVVMNNTGKVVGTVGENVSNMYGDADAAFVKDQINTQLFPLMEQLGYSWEGFQFDWDTTERLGLLDRSAVDKNIADMGMQHSADYINNTYGTEVEVKPEPDPVANPNFPKK